MIWKVFWGSSQGNPVHFVGPHCGQATGCCYSLCSGCYLSSNHAGGKVNLRSGCWVLELENLLNLCPHCVYKLAESLIKHGEMLPRLFTLYVKFQCVHYQLLDRDAIPNIHSAFLDLLRTYSNPVHFVGPHCGQRLTYSYVYR